MFLACVCSGALFLAVLLLAETTAQDYDADGDGAESDEGLYKYPEPGDYPYVVFMTSKAGLCTGVILNELWVLTAANCVYDNRDKLLKDQAVTFKAGINNFDLDSNNQQLRMSAKIVVHGRFVLRNVAKFNVALIKVRESFEFGRFVDKVNLSGTAWPQTKDKLQHCVAAGFGSYYTTSVVSTALKVWNVSAAHGERACPCLKRFQWKRLLCVKEKKFPLLCQRDSGGPLVCNKSVVGIGHMVWDRHSCVDPAYPQNMCRGDPNNDPELKHGISSFYFLCPINDWIRKYVPEVPGTPASCRAPVQLLQRRLFLVTTLMIIFTNNL